MGFMSKFVLTFGNILRPQCLRNFRMSHSIWASSEVMVLEGGGRNN
jgi:hypothetical protein